MNEGWDWELTDRGRRQFDELDEYARERISSKLDEIVDDQWREPTDYLEPLQGVPHQRGTGLHVLLYRSLVISGVV